MKIFRPFSHRIFLPIILSLVPLLPACQMPWSKDVVKQIGSIQIVLPNLEGYLSICETDPIFAERASRSLPSESPLLTCFINSEKYSAYLDKKISPTELLPIIFVAYIGVNPTGNTVATEKDLEMFTPTTIPGRKVIHIPESGTHGFTIVKTPVLSPAASGVNYTVYETRYITTFLHKGKIFVLGVVDRSKFKQANPIPFELSKKWLRAFEEINN